MGLNNKIKQQGFTIVELLIVIVVIGILAAITIVAYNGVQNRGKLASAQSAAVNVAKKAEAANAAGTVGYPATLADFDANPESKMTGSGLGLVTAPVAGTGTNSVSYQKCTGGSGTGIGGAQIKIWDYTANPAAVSTTITYVGTLNAGNAGTCTFAAAPTLLAGS